MWRKVEVNAKSKNIHDLVKSLREHDDPREQKFKCEVLTYIRNNFALLEKNPSHKDEYLAELCKLLIDFISSQSEAKDEVIKLCYSLLTTLLETRYYSLTFFKYILDINRKKRPLIFSFLETLSDKTIKYIVTVDSSWFHFFENCLQNVNSKEMPWLSSENKDNINLVKDVENTALSEEAELEVKIVQFSMSLLTRIYKLIAVSDIQPKELLMDKVMILAYMGTKQQRTTALRLLQQALESGALSDIRTSLPNVWLRYKTDVQSIYSVRMSTLITDPDLDWAKQWNFSVQFLKTDLHKGSGLINSLLAIEEKAFKSTDPHVRRQAFLSWKLLIDNFALEPKELATPRRIKLLCVPLNANNSRTEIMALTKIEVWWHLIITLKSDLSKFYAQVLIPFLNFCFGPLGDTPLLSSKEDINISPGKKFLKTKLAALDALLLLLVVNREELKDYDTVLEERLPTAISSDIFKESYKSILHSVIEALIILQQLPNENIFDKKKTAETLWENFLKRIDTSSKDVKTEMYRGITLIIIELCKYAAGKPVIKSLLFNTILPHLAKIAENFQTPMLSSLVPAFVTIMDFSQMEKQQCDSIRCLLHECIKPKSSKTYSLKSLELLSSIINKMEEETLNERNFFAALEMWCTVAELATMYMTDGQKINENNKFECNFEIIRSIVIFPFSNMILLEVSPSFLRMAKVWKELYKQYYLQSELVIPVKSNEVFMDTVSIFQECLVKDRRCSVLIAYCLSPLIHNINYNTFLSPEEGLSLARLMNNTIMFVIERRENLAIDAALKSLSTMLVTIFGLNSEKVVPYLKIVQPAIECMIKYDSTGSLEKEIVSTWEMIINILKGLGKFLTHELLTLYKDVIFYAARHSNEEVVSNTMLLLNIEDIEENVKNLLSKIWCEATIFTRTEKDSIKNLNENNEKKPVKIIGSFLNRKIESPHPSAHKTNVKKDNFIVHPEPDSQDYVVINSEYNFDFNRLTEHQKEVFKKRREDIPALYNDLSQSSSQDSSHMQRWFEKRAKQFSDTENKDNVTEQTVADVDANKENKIDAEVSRSDKKVVVKIPTKSDETNTIKSLNDEKIDSNATNEEMNDTTKKETNNVDGSASTEKQLEQQDSLPIARKLNFDENSLDAVQLETPSAIESATQRSAPESPSKPVEINMDDNQKVENGEKSGVKQQEVKLPELSKKGMKRKSISGEFESDSQSLSQRRKKDNTVLDTTPMEENMTRRAKTEMSRLRIDMVFDTSRPGRRKSKSSEELKPKQKDCKTGSGRRSSRSLEKEEKAESQESAKKLRKSWTRRSNSVEKEKQSSTKPVASMNEEVQSQDFGDIVESSQENSRLHRKSNLVKINKVDDSGKAPVTTNEKVEKKFDVKESENSNSTITEVNENIHVKETSSEMKPLAKLQSSAINNLSSKSSESKKYLKGAIRGRTLQLLELVAGKGTQPENDKTENENITTPHNKKIKMKDGGSMSPTRKDRTSIFRETDKISSPTGTRQEKMFNNMKAGDFSPSIKTFGNLKNDGEKISPKLEKTVDILDIDATIDKDLLISLSPTKKELPMLEWSSANPPSLNASPSASILKRHSQPELENESITPSKRKRVSFADPPVSREMGYEVTPTSSPHRTSKFSRGNFISRNSPHKFKQLKLKFVQIEQNKSEKDTSERSESCHITDNELLSTAISDTQKVCSFNESILQPEDEVKTDEAVKLPIDVKTLQDKVEQQPKIVECKMNDEIPETQRDMFEDAENSKANMTNTVSNESSQENLEDTIDVQNITPISSMMNSEISEKPIRTSTKTANMNAQEDTLPVTSSMLESLTSNLNSQPVTQENISDPETLDSKDSIYPSLITCQESIEHILENLTNPQWVNQLSSYLVSRDIKTIGDLARLTERELNRLPVKGSSKTLFVRKVLERFEKSNAITDNEKLLKQKSSLRTSSTPVKSTPATTLTSTTAPPSPIENINLDNGLKCEQNLTKLINNTNAMELEKTVEIGKLSDLKNTSAATVEVTSWFGNTDENVKSKHSMKSAKGISEDTTILVSNISAIEPTVDHLIQKPSDNKISQLDKGDDILCTADDTTIDVKDISTASVGTCTETIISPKKQTTTRSVATQMVTEEIFDKLDLDSLQQSVMRRSSPKSIIEMYKAKMEHMAEVDFKRTTMELLGIDDSNVDVQLKKACKASGVNKVLLNLPGIFDGDDQFFRKVFDTYRNNMKASDCLKTLDLNEVKNEMSKQYSFEELMEMTSKKLNETEKTAEESLLMPILSQVTANERLLANSDLLDIAIRNSSDDIVTRVMDNQSDEKKRCIFKKLWTTNTVVSAIQEAPQEQLIEIYRAVCKRWSSRKIVDCFHEIMVEKLAEEKR